MKYPSLSKVKIIIDNKLTKLSLWDKYNFICEGLGEIETNLPEGYYQIDIQMGNQKTRQTIKVVSGEDLIKKIPPLPLPSPVPLPTMSFYNPKHLRAAEIISKNPTLNFGKGSQLFLFLRKAHNGKNENTSIDKPLQDPLTNVCLYDKSSTQVVNFEQIIGLDKRVITIEEDCWGYNIQLAPDYYYLVVKTQRELLARPIITFPGWQTQLFLFTSIESDNEGCFFHHIDLTTGSLVIEKNGFDEKKSIATEIEILKLARLKRQQILSNSEIEEILADGNPMKVLFAAYLLLSNVDSNLELLKKIVTYLSSSFSYWPDVDALKILLSPSKNITFPFPPLLLDSWAIIINYSIKHQDLITLDSLSAQVSRHLWIKEPWLLWNEAELQFNKLYKPSIKKVDTSISELIKESRNLTVKKTKSLDRIINGFTEIENILFNHIVNITTLHLEINKDPDIIDLDEFNDINWEQELVSSLGMPVNVVKDTFVVLKEKISHAFKKHKKNSIKKVDYQLFANLYSSIYSLLQNSDLRIKSFLLVGSQNEHIQKNIILKLINTSLSKNKQLIVVFPNIDKIENIDNPLQTLAVDNLSTVSDMFDNNTSISIQLTTQNNLLFANTILSFNIFEFANIQLLVYFDSSLNQFHIEKEREIVNKYDNFFKDSLTKSLSFKQLPDKKYLLTTALSAKKMLTNSRAVTNQDLIKITTLQKFVDLDIIVDFFRQLKEQNIVDWEYYKGSEVVPPWLLINRKMTKISNRKNYEIKEIFSSAQMDKEKRDKFQSFRESVFARAATI